MNKSIKRKLKMPSMSAQKIRHYEDISMNKDSFIAVHNNKPYLNNTPNAAEPVPTQTVLESTRSEKALKKLIHPVKLGKFFKSTWERKPMLIQRNDAHYYSDWLSTKDIDVMLRLNKLLFGENVDIVSYTDGERITVNPIGRAYAPVVWDYYNVGCSVRILNPHTYNDAVWCKLSILQEFFQCSVGANVYLTPPGSQGFAPHYDDIEAFVLQLEGRKHWRLYSPRTKNEELPRFSSSDFKPDELGECVLDTILEAGDLLYFPRGVIHQADTPPGSHSLHVTVSCYQQNTWADFFLKLFSPALKQAINENVDFRRGLPLDYLNHTGRVHADTQSSIRSEFTRHLDYLYGMIKTFLPIDRVCDEMGVKFIHDSLPPCLTHVEKAHSIHGAGESWNAETHSVTGKLTFDEKTSIRLIRKSSIRLVVEDDDDVRLYHNMENMRIYHGIKQPTYIPISVECAPVVEFLIHKFPKFVSIRRLPISDSQRKDEIVTTLYENGLVMMKAGK